jgi:hypothetical protein
LTTVPDMEAMLMIEPPVFALIICCPTAWATRKVPVMLMSIRRRNLSWS